MVIWWTFLKIEVHKTAIIVSSRLPHPDQASSTKLLLLSAAGCYTRLDGQHCSLRTSLNLK
jgi:hypothetical protein